MATVPWVFNFVTFGYMGLYQYYYFEKIMDFRFGVKFPFSYNFDAVHYLYTLACAGILAVGVVARSVTLLRHMKSNTKDITIRKE